MRILITGGAGLVGSHAAEYFAKKGDEVVVLDNLLRSRLFGSDKKSVEYNWSYLAGLKNVKRIKGDVRKESDLLQAIGKGVDAVIHAAGQPGVPLSIRIPREDFSINAFGTLNVLECVRQKCPEATFIYTSTNKVYGENVDRIPLEEKGTRYVYSNGTIGVSESMPVDQSGHTPYGVSKYVGDIYAQEYGRLYGIKTVVFRMSCIYGTRQFGFEDQGWVAWFVIATLHNRPITIYGDGKQVRDLLWVDDLVQAFDKVIKSNLTHEVFNIGGGKDNTMSLLEFLSVLEKRAGIKPKIEFKDWRASDQKVYVSDIGKVSRKLKWKPEVTSEEGIQKLIDWVRQNSELFA